MTADALKSIAAYVPPPKDYFLGIDPLPSHAPTSVLQFVRQNISQLDPGPGHGPAIHHRFVLIANLETSGCVILDGSTIPLHEGEGILIFPFQSHHYGRLSRERGACWLFTTFEYSDQKELEPLRDASFKYEERDIQRLTRLTSLLKDQTEGRSKGRAAPFELALLLSGLLQRRQRYLNSTGGLAETNAPDIEFLQTTTLYVHRNLGRHIAADDIANRVNLSASRMRSKFRQITGVSLGRYIRETRIHKARELLHGTDLNISQISESCGFESLYSFSRAFRSMIGIPPSRFRKLSRAK